MSLQEPFPGEIRSFTAAWAQPGRKKALSEFTFDRMLCKAERVYREVLSQ